MAEQLPDGRPDPEDRISVTQISTLLANVSMSRSPYPSAEMLAEYERFQPGFADRIIDKIDKQTEHRQTLEMLGAQGDERRKNLGQWFGFITAVLGILAAALLSFFSNGWIVPTVIALVAVGGPPTASVLARALDRFKND